MIDGLDCANCAAKIEAKIKALPAVKDASITFATKQLRIYAKEPDAILPAVQELCASLEPDVRVYPRLKSSGSQITRTYLIDNLDCANCGAKIEKKLNELPGIVSASLTFATKQLRITGKNPDAMMDEILSVCRCIEPDVTLTPKDSYPKSAADTKSSHEPAAPVKESISSNTKELLLLILGAVLFAAGEILEHFHYPAASLIVFIISYLILGGKILLTAAKNIRNGHIFDENFLMSLATLGAFVIREYPEAVGVMLFYRVGEYFEHVAVERSRSQIMDAVDMRPETVTLVTDEKAQTIDAESAAVGDILLIRPGDRIPLDGVVVEGESRIDTSPVTGEPVPVKAVIGDAVISGCVNTSGLLKIRVEKVLSESMVTRILDSVENAAASKPKIDRFITRFARIYTPFVVFLALFTAIVPSLITGEWSHWIYTALTFLVISCPCALVLSIPLAFFSGIGAGSKRGILFKGGVSLEALKNVKAVVMDKTGTITKGNFVLQNILPENGISEDELLTLAAGCESTSSHPIANSILTAAAQRHVSVPRPEKLEEIAGHGVHALIDGRQILCGNQKLLEQFQVSVPSGLEKNQRTQVLIARDGVFAGYLLISDTLKPDAVDAVQQLKKAGIITAMLTGDSKESADAVAKSVGIDEVHARLLPQEKLSCLTDIRSRHGSVMFVGDGINDAPVLAGADVGAAMGSGADAAIEAADVVFMTNSVSAIPQSIAIARATGVISWQNLIFALVVKFLVMILGLLGFASMWMAVFADSGVAMLCVLNSIRILYSRK